MKSPHPLLFIELRYFKVYGMFMLFYQEGYISCAFFISVFEGIYQQFMGGAFEFFHRRSYCLSLLRMTTVERDVCVEFAT